LADTQAWRGRGPAGEVVVKCVSPSPRAVVDFTARASAIARLEHPHAAAVLERGKTQDGHLFAARAYVRSDSLASTATSLTPRQKLLAIVQVAGALDHAHRRGLAHGAIHPCNVFLPSPDAALLTDFALVAAKGTSAFLAPERQHSPILDVLGDQFSLAALAGWLILGRVPGHEDRIGDDPRLDQALRRALHPSPDRRFAHLDELAAALETAPREAQAEPSLRVHVERVGKVIRVRIDGRWNRDEIPVVLADVERLLKEPGNHQIAYTVQTKGGCQSAAIDALADLHRRHRPRLEHVAFLTDEPQARGFSILLGTAVKGLPWKVFASADTMNSWLRAEAP
jgi:serine/threonine protein kinase